MTFAPNATHLRPETIRPSMFFDDGLTVLSDAECVALLASATIGRMSLTIGALPAVLPVNYQYLGGDVIIGMRDGPAVRRLARDAVVVGFEVDNANSMDAFWAVLVIGRAREVIDPDERAQFQALALPAHSRFVRLRPDQLTGYRTAAP